MCIVSESFVEVNKSNISARLYSLLFTKNVHILIQDGGKRKAGVHAPFSVFGQLEKGKDVGSKFVDRRFT